MPTFCRHNRFIENCRICSPSEPTGVKAAPARSTATATRRGLRVSHSERAADDGFRTPLAPGLRSGADAERLAAEVGFAAGRLAELAARPPGLYAEAAGAPDREEGFWLAFLIAYVGPLEGEDPFAGIASARTDWSSGEVPQLDGVAVGPRGAHDPARGAATIAAYRAWAGRAGSQAAAFTGEEHWNPQRRFARAFERLALPGFHRAARFDLLVTLGRLGICELAAGSLFLASADEVAVGAKRAFGIGDPLLLDRRAIDLAQAGDVPLEALDLALFNWQRSDEPRARLGASEDAADAGAAARVQAALGLLE